MGAFIQINLCCRGGRGLVTFSCEKRKTHYLETNFMILINCRKTKKIISHNKINSKIQMENG